jgi:hypothetical protein
MLIADFHKGTLPPRSAKADIGRALLSMPNSAFYKSERNALHHLLTIAILATPGGSDTRSSLAFLNGPVSNLYGILMWQQLG